MSFTVQLHAYEDMGYYEDPILTQAWFEVSDPSVPEDSDAVLSRFREIAAAYAAQHGDEMDPSVLDDFNWGDFTVEIPEDFLESFGVRTLYGNVPQSALVLFARHDELILG